MDDDLALGGLFASSLLAATLLPGGSELVLGALLKTRPELYWAALTTATLGNTLGGMSSYLVGRLFAPADMTSKQAAHIATLRRFGAPALLLSWVPLMGDALCVAAGWLRLGVLPSLLYMALGKFARYWLLAATLM